MPKRANSCGKKARAKPTSRRPPEIASTIPIWPASLSGIVEYRQHRTGDEPDRARHRRCGAEKDERIGAVAAIGQKIVLDRAHVGEAQPLRELRELERLAPVLVGGLLVGTDGRKELNAEFHRSP